MTEYAVVFEQAEDGGWSAYALDVPQVVAAADSRDEVACELRDALAIYRNELAQSGEEPPAPRVQTGTITV